jgi:hypothetical protein
LLNPFTAVNAILSGKVLPEVGLGKSNRLKVI